ncbi:MAG: IS4 family transposase [Phycisphaerales bacterium JB058]
MKLVTTADFGYPYRDAFPDGHVMAICRKHGVKHRNRIFPPEVVVNLWLAQIISGNQSCSDAVARLSAFYALKGRSISAGTGGYVQARQRLPLEVIRELVRQSARRLERECGAYRLIDRPLWTVDGSTSAAPDTESVCESFPKSRQFAPGVGVPLTRYITINSATTGAILSLQLGAMSGKGTGEMSLFREGWLDLERDDIIVGDRLYCGYATIALLRLQGVDSVFRRNRMMKTSSLPTLHRIARNDRVVEIERGFPSNRTLPEQLWKMVPPTQKVRLIRYTTERSGRESKPISLVSSLCSPAYVTKDLSTIYALRWHAETDFRSYKVDLGANKLMCKSPEMIEKELWMAALANNVVRTFMARAARYAGVSPREISFRRTMHFLDRYSAKFDQANFLDRGRLMTTMLGLIAENRVGNRPGRYEPRALKHIGNPYRVLKHPRNEARRDRLYHGKDKKPYRRKRPN